jgi:hypothetical protein
VFINGIAASNPPPPCHLTCQQIVCVVTTLKLFKEDIKTGASCQTAGTVPKAQPQPVWLLKSAATLSAL